MDLSALSTGRRRRSTYTPRFKSKAVAACMQPGVSIASLAMDLRVNANVLRRWIREVEHASLIQSTAVEPVAISAPHLVPVSVSPELPAPATSADLRITVQQGGASLEIICPASAEVRCATLLREWLR